MNLWLASESDLDLISLSFDHGSSSRKDYQPHREKNTHNCQKFHIQIKFSIYLINGFNNVFIFDESSEIIIFYLEFTMCVTDA